VETRKTYYYDIVLTYPLKTRLLVTGELLPIEDAAAALSAHSVPAASEKEKEKIEKKKTPGR